MRHNLAKVKFKKQLNQEIIEEYAQAWHKKGEGYLEKTLSLERRFKENEDKIKKYERKVLLQEANQKYIKQQERTQLLRDEEL